MGAWASSNWVIYNVISAPLSFVIVTFLGYEPIAELHY